MRTAGLRIDLIFIIINELDQLHPSTIFGGHAGPHAAIRRELRQARKGATVVTDSGAMMRLA